MKNLDGIIEEHAYWLRIRGYDEKGLGNNEREGMYKDHLKIAIQHIQDSDIVLFDREPITVHTFGNFGKDNVLFTFNYSFDSVEETLSLQEVQATLDQTAIAVHIETFDDLWPAEMMHARVKELSCSVNEVMNERHEKNVKIIASAAHTYLKEKGYDNGKDQLLERKLNHHLIKADKSSCTVHYFSIKTTLSSNTQAPVKISIHFTYYREKESLRLNWVHATCNNAKEVFFNKTNAPIPSAGFLMDYMNQLAVIEKARTIVEETEIKKQRNNIKR